MRIQNKYDSGWWPFLIGAPFILLAVAALYFFKIGPKLEVCRIYYPEISAWSCQMSDYGLPHRAGK